MGCNCNYWYGRAIVLVIVGIAYIFTLGFMALNQMEAGFIRGPNNMCLVAQPSSLPGVAPIPFRMTGEACLLEQNVLVMEDDKAQSPIIYRSTANDGAIWCLTNIPEAHTVAFQPCVDDNIYQSWTIQSRHITSEAAKARKTPACLSSVETPSTIAAIFMTGCAQSVYQLWDHVEV